MQTYNLPTLSSLLPGATAPAQRRHTFTLHTPSFGSLAALRKNIRSRLQAWSIDTNYIDMLQLSVCEVITNLIKHPTIKPDTVHVTLVIADTLLAADIADNGTPFATFDAKCHTARQCAAACDSLSEGGYGLAFIVRQHTSVAYRGAGSSPDGLNHFTFQSPITAVIPATAPLTSLQPVAHQRADRADVRKKIFIIDDDPLTLDFYRPLLSQHYDILFFRHAADALARFTHEKPSLVISELAMTGMDGITLRRHLGNIAGGESTPFVFLSNTSADAHAPYITQAGIDDYLCKPVSPERLLAVSARVIERASRFTAALQGRISTQITALLNPHLPGHHKGWHIVTRSAVAEAGGGDFTIYKSQPDAFIAILADVMGHGLHAKFFAYAYAGYLRSLIQLGDHRLSPAQFLTQISNAVNADSFLDSTIMTCMAFALEDHNTVALASAGHPPPWRVGARAAPLDIAGPLPGLLGESRYSQQVLKLAKGERIVMATDGFWDSWDNPHTLATDLVASALRPLDDYADILWRTAYERAQTRQRQKDDATLIIIEAGD